MTRYAEKIARIRSGEYTRQDFIIADAKDSDMAGGVLTTGGRRNGDGSIQPFTRQEFLSNIEAIVRQDIVDILLGSTSNMEMLVERGTFANGRMATAVRLNDTTDVWGAIRGARYAAQASRPFRSATLDSGFLDGRAGVGRGVDLGLYSITFNNDLDHDLHSLQCYVDFRREASRLGRPYFLEVFNPNVDCGLADETVAAFVNDSVLRALAGTVAAERPEFLKVVYNGPDALEELAGFDSTLVVGVLGGSAGTTRDCFELLSQAERFGARVALFGCKINLAESPLDLIVLMRAVTDGELRPHGAVEEYHRRLAKLGLPPLRPLADDQEITSAPLLRALT